MLKEMKMRTMVLGGFGGIAGLLLIVGALVYFELVSTGRDIADLAEEHIPGLVGVEAMNEAMTAVQRCERILVYEKDPEIVARQLDQLKEAWENLEKGWQTYEPIPKRREQEALWKEFVAKVQEWKKRNAQVVELVRKGNHDTAHEISYGEARESFNESKEALRKLTAVEVDIATSQAKAAEARASASKNVMAVGMAFGFVGAVGLGMFITRRILGKLGGEPDYVMEIAKKVAAGDMSAEVDTRGKAEDSVIVAMARMVSAIRGMAVEVGGVVQAAMEGRLGTRADVSKHQGEYRKLLAGVNATIGAVVGLLDAMPAPAMIIDREFNIMYMNDIGAEVIGLSKDRIVGSKCYQHLKTTDCNTAKCACAQAMQQNRAVTSETEAHPGGKNLDISYTAVPARDGDGRVIGALEIVTDQTAIKQAARIARKVAEFQNREVEKLVVNLGKLAQGDLKVEGVVGETDEDTSAVGQNFAAINDALKVCVDTLRNLIETDGGVVLEAAANKDLSKRMTCSYMGQYARMKDNINRVVQCLDEALQQVAEAVEQVGSASSQISSGSQSLAQGANEQASALEEVSSSLEELSSMTRQNAANAAQAKTLAESSRVSAERGNEAMRRMSAAIAEIKGSSDQTAKIIKTIDEIAFQTNLLALNAAVEAARAGEAGKGFAVVAEEVRNLAQRSAGAAKNTADMIEDAVRKADDGVKITDEVASVLGEIVDGARKVNDLVAEISAASEEQTKGIEQINTAVAEMNKVTQQNAANAEESASAVEELNSQAQELAAMVASFRLSGHSIAQRGISQKIGAVQRAAVVQPAATVTRGGAGTRPQPGVRKPEEIIPLGDQDLSVF
jgi:methyl-accepting chemotaxis protein